MDLRKVVLKQGSAADSKKTNDTMQYEVEFNYEFLDDYHDTSDDSNILDEASSMEEAQKNKGFIAKWGPKGFSRKNHPLALMVSWFELTTMNITPEKSLFLYLQYTKCFACSMHVTGKCMHVHQIMHQVSIYNMHITGMLHTTCNMHANVSNPCMLNVK